MSRLAKDIGLTLSEVYYIHPDAYGDYDEDIIELIDEVLNVQR